MQFYLHVTQHANKRGESPKSSLCKEIRAVKAKQCQQKEVEKKHIIGCALPSYSLAGRVYPGRGRRQSVIQPNPLVEDQVVP